MIKKRPPGIKIEIGGGTNRAGSDYINMDPNHGEGDWKRLAQDTPWPAEEDSADAIIASHVMEHIPAGQARLDVMNEAHRVLRRTGEFTIVVPLMVGTWHAIADPTHISFWVPESFRYFDGTIEAYADYGIKRWQTIFYQMDHGWQATWTGRPLKNEPPHNHGSPSIGAQMSLMVWAKSEAPADVGPQPGA